jgi:hypothetical protein
MNIMITYKWDCGMIMQDAHLATVGENFIGATANINIWNPRVDRPEDFTTAQIWLKAANGLEVETIEAGWAVSNLVSIALLQSQE